MSAIVAQNKDLAKMLHDIASIYRFSNGENRFRAMAYQNASKVIAELPDDIRHYLETDTLDQIPGVGKTLESNIKEYARTGHIARFDKLKKKVPFELMELMDITGFGPQSLKTIYKKLQLETKEEVIHALQSGMICKLKGFGPKRVQNMLRGLKLHKLSEDRMLLWDALMEGEKIIEEMGTLPGVKKIELAGSLRRRKETVGDFDILISASNKARREIVDYFVSASVASRMLARGDTKASIILKKSGRQADLRLVDDDQWGSALQYFTGSREHNIHLRSIAKDKGYKINEYGIFNTRSGRRVAGKTEDEIYRTLGMQSMPAEMREDKGEIDLAIRHSVPELVTLADIRGDMQMHSNWSDGLQTLDEIVEFVQKNFKYQYIVITDHTKSSRIAGGLSEKEILDQLKVIREINARLGKDFVKAGTEVDILSDGTLDVSDEILSQLDWVTAAIHSGFKHDNTDRLIRACESPYVHCIGHPTGRLIGKRDPYPLDFPQLVKSAKETGTALEINAQPDRLDLKDEYISVARENHVKLVISTDSHRSNDFYFMRLGVYMARRAWCTAGDILNTRTWKKIEDFKEQKHLAMLKA
jgi:DNA polymerase (family 10)